MPLVDRKETLHPSKRWDTSHQKFAYVVSQVTNLTNDGGSRLLLVPSRFNLSTRQPFQRTDTSVYLAFFALVAEVIAKTTIYMFSRQSLIPNVHPQNLPHLEAIEWMKANTCLKQERIGDLLGGAEHRQEAIPPNVDDELSRLIDDEQSGTDEDGKVFPLT